MQSQALHPMLPRQTREEESRHAFLVDLKNMLHRDVEARVRDVYEQRAAPAFRKKHNRDPQNRHEVAKMMRDEPIYQMWSALGRVQQELYVDSTAACVERQLPELIEKYHSLADQPKMGSLELHPEMEIPRYISAVDIHCIPGGYFVELGEDDIYAGARYDIGSYIFGRGDRGPMNDARGQTALKLLRDNFPDFKPTRILDLGCASGMNTLPFVDAFPDAEVIGVDVSAPCLRYAHARAEGLGRKVHFAQRNAEKTGYPDASFDLVTSHILFHETSRRALANILAECHRLLKPGGLMVHVDVPRRRTAKTPYQQFMADWDTLNNNEPFWGTFMFDIDMTEAAKKAGFAADKITETMAPTPASNFAYWGYFAQKS
jgi:ubiquinone/menaquinone biosynthesis C-methylase UbiE